MLVLKETRLGGRYLQMLDGQKKLRTCTKLTSATIFPDAAKDKLKKMVENLPIEILYLPSTEYQEFYLQKVENMKFHQIKKVCKEIKEV